MKYQIAFLLTLLATSTASAYTYGIGGRVTGDQLVINDTLLERPGFKNHTIEFQYHVRKPISYIEIEANANAYGHFGLTPDRVLEGTVFSVHSSELEVKIRVFVVNDKDAPPNFHPVLLPNKRMEYMVVPEDEEDDEYYEDDYDEENVLRLGERQTDDVLLYETYQHSEVSKKPENHSITFYYIDSNFVTFAEFATIGTDTASATFSQVSDHSIKAVIYDEDTKSLDVKIRLYGYTPDKKPNDFKGMLSLTVSDEPKIIGCPTLSLLQYGSASTQHFRAILIIFSSLLLSAVQFLL